MRISCDVVKDLMLLYENGEASEDTKKLVEDHVKNCPSCRSLLWEEAGGEDKPQEVDTVHDKKREDSQQEEAKALKRGLGKIKRRWKLSVASALMLLPALFIAVLTFDQCTGSGIAFTNLDEIQTAKKFMKLLEKQEFEEAAEMLDYTAAYNSIMESIRNLKQQELIALYGENPTKEEYKADRTENVLEFLEKMKKAGYSISNLRFNHVYKKEGSLEKGWVVQIAFVEYGPDSFEQNVIGEFHCNGDKITYKGAMNEKRLSAFEYALGFNSLWNLERIPEYEEYLEMEKTHQR